MLVSFHICSYLIWQKISNPLRVPPEVVIKSLYRGKIHNIGPYTPEMLNVVFSTQKGGQYIFRKTGYYNINILQEIATTWEKHLEM